MTTFSSVLLPIPVISPRFRPILIACYQVCTYRLVFDHILARFRSVTGMWLHALHLGYVACATSFTSLMQCRRILSGSRQAVIFPTFSAFGIVVFLTVSQLLRGNQSCWLQISYHQLIADCFIWAGDVYPDPLAILSVSACILIVFRPVYSSSAKCGTAPFASIRLSVAVVLGTRRIVTWTQLLPVTIRAHGTACENDL